MYPNPIKYLCIMEKTRPNIRHVEVAEIERFIGRLGEKPFRVKQIVEWLWQKHAHSFDEMTDLSKDLRKQLVEHFTFPALQIDHFPLFPCPGGTCRIHTPEVRFWPTRTPCVLPPLGRGWCCRQSAAE